MLIKCKKETNKKPDSSKEKKIKKIKILKRVQWLQSERVSEWYINRWNISIIDSKMRFFIA
jgi:hypothetical protein